MVDNVKNVKEHIVDLIKDQSWVTDEIIFEVIRLEYSLPDPSTEMELMDLWAADIIQCLPTSIDIKNNRISKVWRINPKFEDL